MWAVARGDNLATMKRKRFIVMVAQSDGSVAQHPMKERLRKHPEHIPPGLDPSSNNSHQLRDRLRDRGWSVKETSNEVHLIAPAPTTEPHQNEVAPSRPLEHKQKMSEDEFARRLVAAVAPCLKPHKVKEKRSLLYDLSFDHFGKVSKGVDPEGAPIRGQGRGFEQDILVYDEVTGGDTSVVPRIVAEVKFGGVTTHDVLIYAEKADRIRRLYPYVRYGFVLGGLDQIPRRVLRLGQRFDFIVALSSGLNAKELANFCELMKREAAASAALVDVLFGQRKPTRIEKRLTVAYDEPVS